MRASKALRISPSGHLKAAAEKLAAHVRKTTNAMRTEDFSSLPPPAHVETEFGDQYLLHAHIFPRTSPPPFPASSWADAVIGAYVVTNLEGLEGRDDMQRLIQSFGATTAEARLGAAVLSGQSLYDYADHNRVSRHTVRNQMRALLQKTDSASQADFVSRLLRLASPF